MAVKCEHKSNVVDDCTNSCTNLIDDTFEEFRKLMYYIFLTHKRNVHLLWSDK